MTLPRLKIKQVWPSPICKEFSKDPAIRSPPPPPIKNIPSLKKSSCFCKLIAAKKGCTFQFNFFLSFCIYYISQNYAITRVMGSCIRQAMPHAISIRLLPSPILKITHRYKTTKKNIHEKLFIMLKRNSINVHSNTPQLGCGVGWPYRWFWKFF